MGSHGAAAEIPGAGRGGQHHQGLSAEAPVHSLLPRAAGCLAGAREKTGHACRRTKQSCPHCSSSSQGMKRGCLQPKLEVDAEIPHCTSQLLWLRQPWSSDRCQNMLLLLAPLGKLPLRQPRGPLHSQEASCTGCVFTLLSLKQNPNTSTIPSTPLTAIQQSLMQSNETCRTRLLVSPVHWLSAWPHHQHILKSSDQVRVSATGGTQIPP